MYFVRVKYRLLNPGYMRPVTCDRQNEMLQLNEPKEEFAGAAAGTRILFGGGNHGGPVKTVDIFQLQ